MSGICIPFPQDRSAIVLARIVARKADATSLELRDAAEVLLTTSTDPNDLALAAEARQRRYKLRRETLGLDQGPVYPMPADVAASPGAAPPEPAGGNPFLPAMGDLLPAHSAPSTAAGSVAVVFSQQTDRIITAVCWLILVGGMAFAIGVNHGRTLDQAFVSTQH